MLNADFNSNLQSCPRCGDGGLEFLSTHIHCLSCDYTDTEMDSVNEGLETLNWALNQFDFKDSAFEFADEESVTGEHLC